MPYNSAKDPYPDSASDNDDFGSKGRVIAPSDSNDLDPYAKAVVVTATGDLVILPTENADGSNVTFTGCPVGFIPPFKVRRVLATGTTATVAAIDY